MEGNIISSAGSYFMPSANNNAAESQPSTSSNIANQTNVNGAPKVKKGSYPSKQPRKGPIPLASFEDLPSDDQVSPDDDDGFDPRFSPDAGTIDKVLEMDSGDLLQKRVAPTSPSRTLTPTCTSPPNLSDKRGSDASSRTLGPSCEATPRGSLTPDTARSDSQKQGSHNSLQAAEGQSPKETKRKGSWTDIFFSGRSRSRSPSGRKSPATPTSEESSKKKRNSILKILGFGKERKTSKGENVLSPETTPGIEVIETPRVSVTDTSEELPREELIMPPSANEPQHSEQDILGIIEAASRAQVSGEALEDTEPPYDNPSSSVEGEWEGILIPEIPNIRKKLRHRDSTIDDDVQSLPEVLPSVSRSRSKEIDLMCLGDNRETVVVQIEHHEEKDNSSEAESVLEETKLKAKHIEKQGSVSEDDVEAQTLLTQESVDYDESSVSENLLQPENVVKVEQVKSPRREKLDVSTVPIERPRSATPINVAPLEAYITTATTPESLQEKIKLTLPGEQFAASARAKSPRKSNPSIWLDFCEKGLQQSPRFTRKDKERNNSCPSATPISGNDPFTPVSDSPNRIIAPENEAVNFDRWPGFGDNFVDYNNALIFSTNDSFKCNCGCHVAVESKDDINDNVHTTSEEQVENDNSPKSEATENENTIGATPNNDKTAETQPTIQVPSETCSCLCHQRSGFADFRESQLRNALIKQESASSDISSASSRLIGSSSREDSSTSKCSPTEEAVVMNS